MAYEYGGDPPGLGGAFAYAAGDPPVTGAAANCIQSSTCTAVAGTITAASISGAAASCTQTNACAAAAGTITAVAIAGAAASCTHSNTCTAAAGSITTAALSFEPVTVPEAKIAARIDFDDTAMDSLIAGLITAAREQAEQITGRLYVPTTVRRELADWPAAGAVLPVYNPTAVAISHWDGAAWVALAIETFAFAPQGYGTVVAPALGTAWPALGAVAIGPRVRIDISGGLANPGTAPEVVKLYIKALVSVWVRNPDAAQQRALEPNPLFDRLLDRERLWH